MAHASIAPGQVVAGRYRIESVIGQGGMGVVAAVRHVDLDERFALKVMTPEAFASPEAVERFVREARTAAKLRSAHAAKVVDSGRLPDGAPYLVMEYLHGRDLQREFAARGALPFAEAATYIAQACDVLAEAHSLGIVHRDLKPANLFLTHLPNGAPCIKVLDFGIAKQTDSSHGSRMTQTASVFGTPLYMSPEQMKSAKSADARSDIWSLGVVLYELCTGVVPFDGESMAALIAKVLMEPPIRPGERRPGFPVVLEQVILRCLDREPARRFQSAAELAFALTTTAAAIWQTAQQAPRGPTPSAPHFPPGSFAGSTVAGAPSTQMNVTSTAGTLAGRPASKTGILVGAAIVAVLAAAGTTLALRGTAEPPIPELGAPAAPTSSPSSPPTSLPSSAPEVTPSAAVSTPPPATQVPSASAPPPATLAPSASAPPPATQTPSTAKAPSLPAKPAATAVKPTAKPTSAPATKPSSTRGGFL